MTKEERREYTKRWREQNRERIKTQRKENAMRKAMAELASVKQLDSGICIFRANDGRSYIVTGRKR